MLDTLITIGLIGGAGYLGYRLGKGGTTFKMNPAGPEPWEDGFGGKVKGGRVIDTYWISLRVESAEQAKELVDQLLPVLQELEPEAEVTGNVWGYWDTELAPLTKVEGYPGGFDFGDKPSKQTYRHTAQFIFHGALDTYDELHDQFVIVKKMAHIVFPFPVTYDHATWSEGKPKKKRGKRNPNVDTMNPVDVEAIRRKAANQDMNLVRKEGEIAIVGTREGPVWFQYKDGSYTLAKPDGRGGLIILAAGSPKQIRPVLESLYDVVVQPE